MRLLLGRKPMPGASLEGEDGVGDPPPWFTDAQELVWSELVAAAPPGLLQKWHAHLLERVVVHLMLARELAQLVAKQGITQRDRVHGGQQKQAVWRKGLRSETALLLKLYTSLGFTPSSSAILHIPPPPRELTEFEKLLG